MKIEGKNAVGEAIKSDTTIDRLVVEKGLKDMVSNKIIDAAKAKGIKIFFRDKETLDRESVTGRHGGFIAEVTDFKYCEIADILEIANQRGQKPFILVIDGVEDPHNLGSIIRVAECSGVHGIIIPRHRAVSVNETVIKVSCGASQYMAIAKVTNINQAIESLKEQGIWVYGADMEGENLFTTTLNEGCAIVIGGEGNGVHKLTKKVCDSLVKIPMFGSVNSLNASVATGIVVYEYVKRGYLDKK